MASELSAVDAKPCPSCGQQPTIGKWYGRGPMRRLISCGNGCWGGRAVAGNTKAEALERWNASAGEKP
jgi:hypothetical protein